MRFRPDPSLRRPGDGRVVLGGSPLRLWRLTAAGVELVRRAAAGEDVAVAGGPGRVLDRLVDAGALHPLPAATPLSTADVTVVVPVRDRPDGLDRLLGSVSRCGRPGAVVVVDDGSADELAHARVAAAHGATLLRRERSGGPGVARDDGIARASTPLVAVLDSDCTVTPGWLEPLLGQLADPRVAAVAPRITATPGERLLDRYDALRSPLDLGPVPGRVAPGTRIAYVPAAGLVVRVAAHRAVGGFDHRLRMGEDVDLVWRLVGAGHRVRYEPTSVVVHDVRGGLRDWMGQRFDYGTSAAALDRRHPGLVAPMACSPWSAAGWVLVAAGWPVPGAVVLAGSAAALPRELPDVPVSESLRLAAVGHLGAARQLARTTVRVWWPVAVVGAVASRRARRVVVGAAAASVVEAWAGAGGPGAGDVGPLTFAGLALLDDAAYGAGVWAGCVRQRSFRALLPRLTSWPGRQPA